MYAQNTFIDRFRIFMTFAFVPLFAFTTVLIIPFIVGVLLTFTSWNGISPIDAFDYEWVGFTNFGKAWADPDFLDSLWLTLRYVVFVIVFANVIAFGLALLVTANLPFRNIFRAAFFTPNLIGGVLLGFIWQFIFATFVPYIGDLTGLELLQFSWLVDPDRAFAALIIVSVWQISGYMMLIYIAGLVGIPAEVREAASLDGAGYWRQLQHITLPLMIPAFTISVFLTLRNSFMIFDVNLALTDGGPFGSTEMMTLHIYNDAFIAQNFGSGQAKAIILFVIVAAIGITQVAISNWVERRVS